MSEKIEFKPILTKFSSEIRFRPTLDSWKSVFEAAKELEDSYQEWRIKESKPDDILLYSPDEKASIRICYNRIVYAKEAAKEADLVEMNKQLEIAFNTVIVKSKIKTIAHIGFRKVSVYETKLKNFELTDLVYTKFYNKTENSTLPFTVKDIQVVFDGQSIDGGIGNHLRFGPMDANQAWETFDSPFEETNTLSQDRSYLFLDVDSFSKKDVIIKSVLSEKDNCISNNAEVIQSIMSRLEV